MMLSLGKFGTETTRLASLPFVSMEADIRRTAGRRVYILPAGLVCSDYRGEAIHRRPDQRCGHARSLAMAPARSVALNVHFVERLGGN